MHTRVEKPKENQSRAIANTETQKKSNVKQEFGFVDNRSESAAQRKIQGMAEKTNVIQLKNDHLFNDIPKSLLKAADKLKDIANKGGIDLIREELNAIRNTPDFQEENVHDGKPDDENSKEYGVANENFLKNCDFFKGIQNTGTRQGMYYSVENLWKKSIDYDVVKVVKGKGKNPPIEDWLSKKSPIHKALRGEG